VHSFGCCVLAFFSGVDSLPDVAVLFYFLRAGGFFSMIPPRTPSRTWCGLFFPSHKSSLLASLIGFFVDLWVKVCRSGWSPFFDPLLADWSCVEGTAVSPPRGILCFTPGRRCLFVSFAANTSLGSLPGFGLDGPPVFQVGLVFCRRVCFCFFFIFGPRCPFFPPFCRLGFQEGRPVSYRSFPSMEMGCPTECDEGRYF